MVSEGFKDWVARFIDGRSQDVRDVVRVARLASSLGVERAISLLLPEGGGGLPGSYIGGLTGKKS